MPGLTPEGRRILCERIAAGSSGCACGRRDGSFSDYGVSVVAPVSGRGGSGSATTGHHDRCRVRTRPQHELEVADCGTSPNRKVGSGSDRVDPGDADINSVASAVPPRVEPAGVDGPSHRASDPPLREDRFRASWSTSTSRNWDVSPMVAAGGRWVEPVDDATAAPIPAATRNPATSSTLATDTSTPPSTTTPGSPTSKSSQTRKQSPPQGSPNGPSNWFADDGIAVEAVMTDNGSCYRTHLYHDTLTATGVTHVRIPPRQPQLNGKVERFNRTLLDEWAYVRPYRSEDRTTSSPCQLAPHLQPSPQPHRHRRPTHQPCNQPGCSSQLAGPFVETPGGRAPFSYVNTSDSIRNRRPLRIRV